MIDFTKIFFVTCVFFLLAGCTPKIKIYELSDNAFIENNKPVTILSNDNLFPLFNQMIINELSSQIKYDNFLVDSRNFGYIINIETKNHDQFISRNYEPVYKYQRYCDRDGNCRYIPRVYYIPCIDIFSSTILYVNATNIEKNNTMSFSINNREFANNCNRFESDFGYYNHNYYGYYSYYDRYLFDNLNQDNIKAITKKIKDYIFPIKTINEEVLYKKIESVSVAKDIDDIFTLGYNNFKNKNYSKAINIYEKIRNSFDILPDELLFNLGALHEYFGDLTLALDNYNLLSENFINKNRYTKRVSIKMRYENK